ncbi:hypothetical protein ElyMa_001504700 [Elysia marginata]|uniref:Uncharacterized protein n=1 Tax=Elysia marginata TaxID=1093978 RepID=A0AAV4JB13_9GAST|nr:hypothetical protein ElyMa_001504700 [Elysia marginata]
MIRDEFVLTLLASCLLFHIKATSQAPADPHARVSQNRAIPSVQDVVAGTRRHKWSSQDGRRNFSVASRDDARLNKHVEVKRAYYYGRFKVTSVDVVIDDKRSTSFPDSAVPDLNQDTSLPSQSATVVSQKPKINITMTRRNERRTNGNLFANRMGKQSFRLSKLKIHKSFQNSTYKVKPQTVGDMERGQHVSHQPYSNLLLFKNDRHRLSSLKHSLTRPGESNKTQILLVSSSKPGATLRSNATRQSAGSSSSPDIPEGRGVLEETTRARVRRDTGLISVSVQSIVPVFTSSFFFHVPGFLDKSKSWGEPNSKKQKKKKPKKK